MPSSTSFGSRPRRSTMRLYSSRERAISSRVGSSTGTSSEYAGHDVGGREVSAGDGESAAADGEANLRPDRPVLVPPHQVEAEGREDVAGAGHHPHAFVPAATAGRI